MKAPPKASHGQPAAAARRLPGSAKRDPRRRRNGSDVAPRPARNAGAGSLAVELPTQSPRALRTGDLASGFLPAHEGADSLISRRGSVRRLESETQARVIALIAPTGYGKSSLLAEWARSDPRTFAWIDICDADNEPDQLEARLRAALEQLSSGEPLAAVGDGVSAQRRRRRRMSAPQAAAPLADFDGGALPDAGGVLVLDGLERLHAPEALATVLRLAGRPPLGLTIALASRREPAGLSRLRTRPGLLELGRCDLAMSTAEVREVLTSAGVPLDDATLDALTARSEGWPAGVYMIASARSASSGDPAAQGSDQADAGYDAIARFMREEALRDLDPEALSLLRRCSILQRLSGEACDAILGFDGSGRLLRELASSGTMIFAEDAARTRFRLHRLLREVLRTDLAVCEPAESARLHRRASRWYARHGEIEQAIRHAAQARDAASAGRLLWEHAPAFLYGRDRVVADLIRDLSAEQVASSPQLLAVAAHCRLALGDLAAARRWARRGNELLDATTDGRRDPRSLDAVSAALELVELAEGHRGAEPTAAALVRLERRIAPAGALSPLRGLLAGVSLHLLGEVDAAEKELDRAVSQCAGTMPVIEALSLAQLGVVCIEREDWAGAEQWTSSALEVLTASRLDGDAIAALAHAAAGLALSRVGRADDAKSEVAVATRALDGLSGFLPWYEVQTRLLLARAHTRLTEAVPARALLTQASRWARRREPAPRVLAWLDEAWGEIDELGAGALSGQEALTMAELRVLRFLPTHLSFREIGERLQVSSNTVKTQAHAIYTKLKARSRSEAVARAAKLGLIEPPVL
jgi:LuxR family transcriptional regulator, maltose regulon positive regulatory protein